jgi:hypothetical protein
MNKICTLLAAAGFISTSVLAVTPGQVDTFQNGTTDNWSINLLGMQPPPPAALPANIPTGGPAGLNDNFLELTSVGSSGAGGRLVALNPAQWSGDYIGAGISAISMDVNNLGSSDLYLRLQFEDPQGAPPNDIAISQNAIIIPAGSGWRNIVFPIAPGDLTAAAGSVQTALADTTILRILHSTDGSVPGAPIIAQLGVDNITALSNVPDAGSNMLLLAGACASLALVHRNRREESVRAGR